MTPEQRAAFIMAAAARVFALTAAMHSENQERLAHGLSIAYTMKEFEDMIEREGCNHNAVLTLFRG